MSFPTPTPTPTPTQVASLISPVYSQCASINGTCALSSNTQATAASTTNGPVFYRNSTNNISCDPQTFTYSSSGPNMLDPSLTCFSAQIPEDIVNGSVYSNNALQNGFSQCAVGESNQICTPNITDNQTADVLYGIDGKYVYANVTTNVPCSADVFGDPNLGVAKNCYSRVSTLPTPVLPTPTATPIPSAIPTATPTATPTSSVTPTPSATPPAKRGLSRTIKIMIVVIPLLIVAIIIAIVYDKHMKNKYLK